MRTSSCVNDQLDAILRAHKKRPPAIPIQALRSTGRRITILDLMNWRRLAWFVPRSSPPGSITRPARRPSVRRERPRGDRRRGRVDGGRSDRARDVLRGRPSTQRWPPLPPRAPDEARSARRRDTCSVSPLPVHPLEGFRVARDATRGPGPPRRALALTPSELALEHLPRGRLRSDGGVEALLAHEAVADRLGEAFEATGEHQARLQGEATVRRNIARREDV